MDRTELASVNENYKKVNTKYIRSNRWQLFFKLAMPTLALATFILGLISVNSGVDNQTLKTIFIVITILSGVAALCTTLIAAFTFGVFARSAKNKIAAIEAEEAAYKARSGEYKDAKSADEAFIRKATQIDNG